MDTSLQERIGEGIRVIEVLRQSGAELLVSGRDLAMHVPVVLKVLDLELASNDDDLRRFEGEAAQAAEFRHLNIATVQPLQRRANLVFYALNVGYARTLESVLEADEPLSYEASLQILRDIASALDFAHSQGIAHERLGPELIFVDEGDAIVSGFGAAHIGDAASATASAPYRAPEQFAWRYEVDGRADVYALGVIAFELISGKRAHAASLMETNVAESFAFPRDVPLRDGLGLQVNEVILHALAKRPSLRFATAGEFVAALENCDSSPVSTLRKMMSIPRAATARTPRFPTLPKWPKRVVIPRRVVTGVGTVALCVAAALTIFSLGKRIDVSRIPSTVGDSFSRLAARIDRKDSPAVRKPPVPTPTHTSSGTTSARRRVSASGVVVENGILVFPHERVADSLSRPSAAARRRARAVRELEQSPTP